MPTINTNFRPAVANPSDAEDALLGAAGARADAVSSLLADKVTSMQQGTALLGLMRDASAALANGDGAKFQQLANSNPELQKMINDINPKGELTFSQIKTALDAKIATKAEMRAEDLLQTNMLMSAANQQLQFMKKVIDENEQTRKKILG